MTDISREFDHFMDPDKMLRLFQRELPACRSGILRLTGIAIQHPRFKTYLNPGSRDKSYLALAYHLSGINKLTREAEILILYVKAYLGKRSLSEYRKAQNEATPEIKQAIIHFSDHGLIAWQFPGDPALPWLEKTLNVEYIENYFANILLPEKHGLASIIKNIDIYIVNYRPELRCTCCYEVQYFFGNRETFYGKTFYDGHGSEIFRRMSVLFKRSEHNPAGFAIAEAVAYDAAIRTIWMKGLPGQSLLNAIKEENSGRLLVRLAENLADFHNAGIDGLPVIDEDFLLDEIRKKSAKLIQAFPVYAGRIEKLLVMLEWRQSGLPPVPHKLIHGDFHINQLLLLADNRIALFDYDELALANPLLDIANFCADLCTQNLPENLIKTIIARFFSEYRKFSGLELNQNHFAWHLRVQFLTRAYRAYVQQKSDMGHLLERFLAAAESDYEP